MPTDQEQGEPQEINTETDTVTRVEEADEVPFKYSITSYGADFPVDGLVKRIARKDIFIPTFQRGYVWSLKDASRFVESLLLGLPVPSVFLSREPDSQKMMVIDGQQRLLTLQYFYEGIWPSTKREFALKGVQEHLENVTYKSLGDEHRRRLDDSIIHAIIVKQDEPSDDASSIYHIFERLNAGGVLLTPQEIRTAIFHGELIRVLKDLNANLAWRQIYGPVSKNMRDQELILRFLALNYSSETYKRPMKEFLNLYLGQNKDLAVQSEDVITRAFKDTIEIVHRSVGERAFKPVRNLNAAVFDGVMVGIARRLRRGPMNDTGLLQTRYDMLLANIDFRAVSEKSTADEESVSNRLRLAIEAFADVP
jgi:uncharacterized protein with ParB-like and HNH nuclease domain